MSQPTLLIFTASIVMLTGCISSMFLMEIKRSATQKFAGSFILALSMFTAILMAHAGESLREKEIINKKLVLITTDDGVKVYVDPVSVQKELDSSKSKDPINLAP